jgi:ABC-type antimicrobial peptide transport system permease subunit
MSETLFSINDLLRRRSQTALVIVGIALCVASTLFLLLFGDSIGFGVLSATKNTLTVSFSIIFSRFILLAEFLVFVIGIVIISSMVHSMMVQHMKDIGLMKAAGCPNDLVFGYFMNELIIISIGACLLGIVLGTLAAYLANSVFTTGLQAVRWRIVPVPIIITFVTFVAVCLIFGTRPVLTATKVQPATVLSPAFSVGLNFESDFKGVSRAGVVAKIAVRNLFRRRSASFRIVLCLTIISLLITVSVAGGMIADETTKSWIEGAVGSNVILIAQQDMTTQYESLLSRFYVQGKSNQFNYTDERYLLPEGLLSQLESIPGLRVDPRLILEAPVYEVSGILLGQTTGETLTVGDSRTGTSLVIGIEPSNVLDRWFLNGNFLNESGTSEAMIGDTLAMSMFSQPLIQSITLLKTEFPIASVCVDPLNNGNITYVPLKDMQNITGILQPNIIMVKIDAAANEKETLDKIDAAITNSTSSTKSIIEVTMLDRIVAEQSGFLSYVWSIIMLLPLLSLVAAALSLIGYVALAVSDQRQDFGILRAVGAKPGTVAKIVMLQNLLILLSSWATGVALGIITTLVILIPEPIVTNGTVIELSAWLFIALSVLFVSSLYPVFALTKKPILEVAGHQ